ncbi:hypothetical protein B0A55_01497 [Friedmanniomyces simplex]|uniref:BTB domain-containing protein n=1 Tax=Friedmanniomyces simplex TaxID=329884 RepID=A0A4U0Y0U7_9PEZI|nr:hypothetical protein B0A55_01497 [Friedmanniomyces simplex]
MSLTSLAFSAPLPPSIWTHDHPALRFYAAYLQDFSQHYDTADPEAYYAPDCKMIMPDGSIVKGGIWEYVGRELYGAFLKVTREMLSLIVVSDEEAGTHDIHIQLVTSLNTGDSRVDLPQAFTYTVGKADEAINVTSRSAATPIEMARTFDVTSFFDQEAFSDITVKFGTRERRCHKMILCSKSIYFNDLCGPAKKFAEAQQPIIELKDDDEEAVEALLRWLYTFDYEHRHTGNAPDSPEEESTIDFHLSVCLVADKYLLQDLKNEALSRLRTRLETAVDESEFTRVLIKVRYEDITYPPPVLEIADEVRDARLGALVRNEAFRELLGTDAVLCLEMMDKMLAGKVLVGGSEPELEDEEAQSELGDAFEEKAYFRCNNCRRQELLEASTMAWACNNQRCVRAWATASTRQTVWVKK